MDSSTRIMSLLPLIVGMIILVQAKLFSKKIIPVLGLGMMANVASCIYERLNRQIQQELSVQMDKNVILLHIYRYSALFQV